MVRAAGTAADSHPQVVDTAVGIAESVDTVVVVAVVLASLAVSGSCHKTSPRKQLERHTGDTDTTVASQPHATQNKPLLLALSSGVTLKVRL